MRITATSLLAAGAAFAALLSVTPVFSGSAAPTQYVLVSWHGPPECVYVILSHTQYMDIIHRKANPKDDYPQRHLLLSVRQLESAIGQLPEGSQITWTDHYPAATAFPAQDIIEHIKTFAANRSVEVRIGSVEPE